MAFGRLKGTHFYFIPLDSFVKTEALEQWKWVITLLNSRSNCNDSSPCIVIITNGLIMILALILYLLSFKLFSIPPPLQLDTYQKAEMILPVGRNHSVPYPSSSRLHNCFSAWSLFSRQPDGLPK